MWHLQKNRILVILIPIVIWAAAWQILVYFGDKFQKDNQIWFYVAVILVCIILLYSYDLDCTGAPCCGDGDADDSGGVSPLPISPSKSE